MAVSQGDTFDALDLLKEDIKDDDNECVIASVNRLLIIATAIGTKRTREQLIPLMSNFDENNEEALSLIAKQLGDFLECVGGVEFGTVLLPPLEKLACCEETVIREMAVESLNKLHGLLTIDQLLSTSVPLVKRLVQGEWFTNRISACGVLNAVYKRVPVAVQDEMRLFYNILAHDDTPMVRKAAYQATPGLIVSYRKEHVVTDLIPALKTLCEDAADSTRVCLVDCVLALLPIFSGDEFIPVVSPLLDAIADDSSWRVRAKFGKTFEKFCEVSPAVLNTSTMLPLYAKLLRDNESEVRQAAVQSLLVIGKVTPVPSFMLHIFPIFANLIADPVSAVRSMIGLNLCLPLGRDHTQNSLLPLILKLLKDEEPEARLNVIGRVNILVQVLTPEQVASVLTPIIVEMAHDAKWRVRLSVVEKLSMLASQLGAQVFEKSLRDVVIVALSDSVHAVRVATAEQVRTIVEVMGADWSLKKLLPPVFALYEQSVSYLLRIVPVMVIGNLSRILTPDALLEHCVPLLMKACKDPVSNVRFGAAKAFEQLIPRLDGTSAQQRIKGALLEMKNEERERMARLLNELDTEDVSSRPGPGGSWKTFANANEIFGFNGWSSEVKSYKEDFCLERGTSDKFDVGIAAIVRVTLKDGCYHEDIGYGGCENMKGRLLAMEKSKKEASTDACKRALRLFGNALGGNVHSKEVQSEFEQSRKHPKKADQTSLTSSSTMITPVATRSATAAILNSSNIPVNTTTPINSNIRTPTAYPAVPIYPASTTGPTYSHASLASAASKNYQAALLTNHTSASTTNNNKLHTTSPNSAINAAAALNAYSNIGVSSVNSYSNIGVSSALGTSVHVSNGTAVKRSASAMTPDPADFLSEQDIADMFAT